MWREERVQKLLEKPLLEQRHKDGSIPDHGDVSAIVRWIGLDSDHGRLSRNSENFPDKTSQGHTRDHSLVQVVKC